MANIFRSMEELIGNTPLLELGNLMGRAGLQTRVLAKLESRNPGGSAKDRVALNILNDAEAKGLLRPGSTVIEPTSGNTGIGLCAIAAARGYRCVIVMPDTMSVERRRIMTAYGGELVLTPGREGMAGAIAKAEQLSQEIPGSFLAGQFVNPANPEAHYRTTGPEVWRDCDGNVDIFVAGIGTGGTVSGVGRYLKEQNPRIQIIGVEPAESPVISGGKAGSHGIQGIGAGFVPENLDRSVLDAVIPVTVEEAYTAARRLGTEEGILAGISSGAALHAALQVAALPQNTGKTVVVLLPDSGERYLSTPLFSE